MRKAKYIVPIDPKLRAQVLKIVERYKVPQPNITPTFAEVVQTAMKTTADLIDAHDRGELSVTTQKQLIKTMKKIVAKYPL